MRKRNKFIFYFFALISPLLFLFAWLILGIFILWTTTVIFGPQSSGLFFLLVLFFLPAILLVNINKLNRSVIKKYNNSGGKISTGSFYIFEFLWGVISIALISAIITPLFFVVRSPNYTSAVKNALVNGIKECMVKERVNESTNFLDAISFSGNYTKFKIEPLDPNSCYEAKAVSTNDKFTWFEIDYDPETGKVSKTCGDSSKPGCEKGNTW